MLFILAVTFLFLVALRIYLILPRQYARIKRSRQKSDTFSVAVFLGSGGHTTEALALVSALDPKVFIRRKYLVSQGDTLSVQKALDYEAKISSTSHDVAQYELLIIPRARKVRQALITTPLGALKSLLACIRYITLRRERFADVLILNGPGTSFILCTAVYINRFFGLPSPLIIYVETFARVYSLSLSGKLIRPLADRFVHQWPTARQGVLSSKHWVV